LILQHTHATQIEKTLKDLQTDYLDGYLVHWPVPEKHIEAYKVMEEYQQKGILRTIGISNYTIEDYEELKRHMSFKPTVNQIEVNPFLYRKTTIDYFHIEGVRIEAYRALRNGKQHDNDKIIAIAATYNVTVPQILVKWGLQHDLIVVAKSSNKARMQQNLDINGFTISPTDMAILDNLTTPEALEEYRQLYIKCVVRDTPWNGTTTGVKPKVTVS